LRLLLLILLTFSTLLSADDNDESYLGSSYNLNLAFEPSCLTFLGATDVINEHIGWIGRASYCNDYTDDAQNYLNSSLILGSGLAFYSHSIYRDSFLLSLSASLDRTYVKDVVDDITGVRMTVSGLVGLGYQWQFQRGYIFTLAMYYTYRKPFAYETTSDNSLNDELSRSSNKFTPTFLIGWRF